jgi:NAD-dependent dihydropyrimidine dehydrogenase PreA subunit
MEKLFPIAVNPEFCIRCEKCSYSCPSKAIFFRNSLRYVDYNKCQGCLKCVDVCEHNAIEVISMEEGKLSDFKIDVTRCNLCKVCIEENFCFQKLFSLEINNTTGKKRIVFNKKNMEICQNCLKCFRDCPNNAIIPIIIANNS